MKRIGLVIALLISFVALSKGQSQWLIGLTQIDTAQFRLMTTPPGSPVSGYLANVNGYALWWDGVEWDTLGVGGAGGGGGISDHGALTGLGDDDHPHYYNLARLTSWYGTQSHTGLTDIGTNTHTQIDVHLASVTNPHSVDEEDILPSQSGEGGKVLSTDGANSYWITSPTGVTDHGLLNGLGDDDHTIYHTASRANIWFATQNISNLANKSHTSLTDIGSNTHTQIDSHISSTLNPHSVEHDQLGGLADDDHSQYLNTTRANSWFATKSHTGLLDIGTNTHAQLDTHVASTSNPHFTQHDQLGGLTDDDHSQYHNNARADTWFLGKSILLLTDTPSSFSGQAEKVLAVNSGETALEFVEQTGGGDAAVSTLLSTTLAPDNTTTYVAVGDTFDVGLSFRYEAKRDMSTELAQSGHIDIVYDSIAGTVTYSSSYVGADLGLDITADLNADDIRVVLDVDNANTNDLTFYLYSSAYSDIDTIITNSPNKAIAYTDCPDNATTNISLGILADVAFRISYIAERNLVPARKQAGMIDILYDDVAGTVSYFNDYVGTDLGFDIEADLSGSDIRLNIIVDNSTTNNLLFDYKIISKFYE